MLTDGATSFSVRDILDFGVDAEGDADGDAGAAYYAGNYWLDAIGDAVDAAAKIDAGVVETAPPPPPPPPPPYYADYDYYAPPPPPSYAAAVHGWLRNFIKFYWVLLGLVRFSSVLQGPTGFYWVLLGFTGFSKILFGVTGSYWVLLGFT